MICSFPGCKAEAEWVTTHREPGTPDDFEEGLCQAHFDYHASNYPDDVDLWTRVDVGALEINQFGTQEPPPSGSVVEWYAQPASIFTGIVANADPVRRTGRLSHYRPDGSAVIYDADGIRAVIIDLDRLTVLAEHVEAGWGKL